MTTFNYQCSSLLFSKVVRVQSKQDNQVYKEMKGYMLWSQLPSDRKNIGLEKQQKTLLIMRFMLPNFRIMQKKDCSFRMYQNLKITHAAPDHPFLAITQNWAMRLFVGFVMQGHIWRIFFSSKISFVYNCSLGQERDLYFELRTVFNKT